MSFNTLVNFRDFGDYKTKDGRQIVSHRLLRSGELSNLSAEDIDLLVNEYKLKEIIDFRSTKEITERPDEKIPGATYNHIDMFKGDDEDAPALEQIEQDNANRTADERMMFAYEHLIVSPVSQRGFRQFFEILLNNAEGASIWHCFAGKDRTGLAGALILYLLDASEETIIEDYLRTNESRANANEALMSQMKEAGASDEKIADMHVMLTVKLEYLKYSLKIINEQFESLDNYIATILNITDAEIAKFREIYVM